MKAKRFFRVVSSVLLVTISSMTMQPLQAAIQVQRAQAKNAPAAKAADEKYGETLREIEEQSLKAKANRKAGKSSKAEAKAIRTLVRALDALDADVEEGFAATERHLKDKNLAPVILDRHNEAVTTFRQKRNEFRALMSAVDAADDTGSDPQVDSALTPLGDFFEKHSQVRKRAKLDPNNLPWRTPEVTKRLPITDPKAFKTARFGHEPTRVAGALPAGTVIPKALSGKPTAEDLAETEDAQITPAIRAKAQELGNDPLKIYLWVRNNVRFTPTYGSIQGSQDTLDKLSGNAFDTASLLIALLRAANVPARYAYGTIDVPVDQAMNWVGGVTKVEAAQQVLGQGGIPNAPIISGGVVRHIRMEHVWVEAWVDYLPSRGAWHVEGDTWVPVDGSFKQYAAQAGMKLHSAVPFNGTAYTAGALQGATVNNLEGWIQNPNQANVRTALSSYATQLETHIASRNAQATAGDVLGKRIVIKLNDQVLSGVPPYRVVARGPTYAVLPASLRHQFKYTLYAGSAERSFENPIWEMQRSVPSIAGKQLTITFRPTTQADADLIASYIPAPSAGGTAIPPTQFPSTIPAYARVTPELKVNGEVVATGGSFPLGAELAGQGGYTQFDLTGWDITPDDSIVAGQTSALGLSIQGVNRYQLERQAQQLNEAKAKLQANDFTALKGEDLLGHVLNSNILSYFAAVQGNGEVSGRESGVIDQPALSYGLFHASVVPNKLFGIVTTTVSFPGVMMDIGHLRHVRWATDHDAALWRNYNRARGIHASFLEGTTPEFIFGGGASCFPRTPTSSVQCPVAISAAKAIGDALVAGQKVYVVTESNKHVLSGVSMGDQTASDIEAAIAAGKEVTVHEARIGVGNWSAIGYFVVDPDTGAGAYMIEGGARGALGDMQGFCLSLGLSAGAIAMLGIAGGALLAPLATPLIAVLALVTAAVLIAQIVNLIMMTDDEKVRGCLFQGANISIKLLVGRAVAGLMAKRVFGDPNMAERILAALGLGWEAADPFIPDTPVQECLHLL